MMTTQSIVQQEHPVRATPAPRRIYNPIIKDSAMFLETSANTNGQRTLIEIELAPGGQYLRQFT